MTTKELIVSEVKKIPEPLLEEMLDFIRFLEVKILKGKTETMLLSESALRKDWLSLEEDRAWQDL